MILRQKKSLGNGDRKCPKASLRHVQMVNPASGIKKRAMHILIYCHFDVTLFSNNKSDAFIYLFFKEYLF